MESDRLNNFAISFHAHAAHYGPGIQSNMYSSHCLVVRLSSQLSAKQCLLWRERVPCGFGSLAPVCCPSTLLPSQRENCASKFSLNYFANGGTRILGIDPRNLALYGIFMRVCNPVVMSWRWTWLCVICICLTRFHSKPCNRGFIVFREYILICKQKSYDALSGDCKRFIVGCLLSNSCSHLDCNRQQFLNVTEVYLRAN